MQLVGPYNHRSNAAERAIQTFKNHTITGLCTCDKDFPSVLWCKVIKQAQDTLNMLRTSCVHPKLSAYHVLEVPHDFHRVPFAPPGTLATILNQPETRTSWGPRAMDAWYLSPAYDHYRAWLFHIPSKGENRVSGQAVFYPTHCNTPQTTPMDEAAKIAATLVQAIRRLLQKNTQFPGRHDAALQQLAENFQHATTKTPTQQPAAQQSSTNLMSTADIRAAPACTPKSPVQTHQASSPYRSDSPHQLQRVTAWHYHRVSTNNHL